MRSCLLFPFFLAACLDFASPAFTPEEKKPLVVGPSVLVTFPRDADQGVQTTTAFTVVFTKAMDKSSVRLTSTPQIFDDLIWDLNDSRVSSFPNRTLDFSAPYIITIFGTDTDGIEMTPVEIAFATEAAPVEPAPPPTPTVTTLIPASASTGVALRPTVSVTFSVEMLDAEVTLNPTASLGTSGWNATHTTLSFAPPDTDLLPMQTYAMQIMGTSAEGVPLATTTATFTTLTPPDTTAPTVIGRSPAPSDTGVPINNSIVISFSEPMDTSSVAISLQDGAGPIPAATTFDPTHEIFTVDPTSDLPASTPITVNIGAGAKDVAQNALASTGAYTFTTGAAPDTTAPAITSVTPPNGTVGVARNAVSLSFVFSEPMNRLGFSVTNGTAPVDGTSIWNPTSTQLTWTPVSAPAHGTTLTWQFNNAAGDPNAAADPSGNELSGTVSGTLRVMRHTDPSHPVIIYAKSGLDNEGHIGANSQGPDTAVYSSVMFGDWDYPEVDMRGFVTFDMTDMLAGITHPPATLQTIHLESAVLNVYRSGCKHNQPDSGTAGYTGSISGIGLGSAYAEGVYFDILRNNDWPLTAETLDNLDPDRHVLCAAGTPTCLDTLRYSYWQPADCSSGYKTLGATLLGATTLLDVGHKLRHDIAHGRTKSQWQFRFSTTTDGAVDQDWIGLFGGSASISFRPKVSLQFEYP